jgi:hypothetical protein
MLSDLFFYTVTSMNNIDASSLLKAHLYLGFSRRISTPDRTTPYVCKLIVAHKNNCVKSMTHFFFECHLRVYQKQREESLSMGLFWMTKSREGARRFF